MMAFIHGTDMGVVRTRWSLSTTARSLHHSSLGAVEGKELENWSPRNAS
jgi:hypothetical protein